MVTKFYDILLLIVDYCTFRNALHIVSYLLSKWYSVFRILYSVVISLMNVIKDRLRMKDK